jgi:proliferating cell nuclear antigen
MALIIDPGHLEEFLANAEAAVEECKCHLTDDGMRIAAVGPSNVLMVDETLPKEAFESYDVDDMPVTLVGFQIARFKKVLALAGDGPIELTIDDVGRYVFRVTSSTLDHTVSLIDPTKVRDEPDISADLDDQLQVTTVVERGDLSRMNQAADLVSDHVHFGANPTDEKFVSKAAGDNDSTRIELGESETIDLDIGIDEPSYSMFSTTYIENMLGPIDSSSEVTIQVDNDMPMTLDFTFADGHGEARYIIAPRLEK